MTCSFGKGRVGYQGQKYAVVGDTAIGERSTLGFQNSEDIKGWKSLAKHLRLKKLRVAPAEEILKDQNPNEKMKL